MVGIYNRADLPKNSDVFKRYENCRCQVIYKTIKYKHIVNNQNLFNNKYEEVILIPKSVGVSGRNYPVKLPDGGHAKLVEGTSITKIKLIAGNGTNIELRDAIFLESAYNIKASEWMKMRCDGYVVEDGKIKHVEIHWCEAKGVRVRMKVKRYFGDES